MKRYIFLLFSLMSVCFLQAQRVRVAAPKQVTVGEEFQVEYVVYTQDVRRFQLGRLSNGVEKYLGRQLHHNPIINLLMDMQVVHLLYHSHTYL